MIIKILLILLIVVIIKQIAVLVYLISLRRQFKFVKRQLNEMHDLMNRYVHPVDPNADEESITPS